MVRPESPITPPSEEGSTGLQPLAYLCTCLTPSTEPTISSDAPLDEEQISRNVQALKNRLRGKGKRRGIARIDSGSGKDSHNASE